MACQAPEGFHAACVVSASDAFWYVPSARLQCAGPSPFGAEAGRTRDERFQSLTNTCRPLADTESVTPALLRGPSGWHHSASPRAAR